MLGVIFTITKQLKDQLVLENQKATKVPQEVPQYQLVIDMEYAMSIIGIDSFKIKLSLQVGSGHTRSERFKNYVYS